MKHALALIAGPAAARTIAVGPGANVQEALPTALLDARPAPARRATVHAEGLALLGERIVAVPVRSTRK